MSNNPEKPSRTSGADYPVNPAERSSQEARLKKAAAAAANASKSPIPALMLQVDPSLAGAQKTPTIKPGFSQPAAAAPPPAAEISATRSEPGPNQAEVLAVLQQISAGADLQRKLAKWSLVFLAILVSVVLGMFLLMERRLNTTVQSNPPPHQADWYDVDRDLKSGDFEKATALGEELILKTPQYPEGHQQLAKAYLAAGNLDKAREHFAEAFRLFPSEENEKLLSATEKRIKADKP